MSDPTPTPTPREVLDAVLASPNGRAIAAMYGPEFTGRTLPTLVSEILTALAATGDAPLAAEDVDAIEHPDFTSPEHLHRAAKRLLTAYTTLAAQIAAARAERDALRERVKVLETPTVYWDDENGEVGYEDPSDLADSRDWVEPGIYEVTCAHNLPNRFVVIAPDADDPDDVTCIDYATKDEAQAAYDATPARPTDAAP